LQFSLTSNSSVFKDRAPRPGFPLWAQRTSNIPKRGVRRKGVRRRKFMFFQHAPNPLFTNV